MASGAPQPNLRRRPSVSQAFRRLARRLSITSLSQSRTPRSPQLKPISPSSSTLSTSRPPSRIALPRFRRPSNAPSVPTVPETSLPSWPPPATLLRKGKHSEYDVTPFLQCTRVPELWDESESADTLVYLCAKEDAAKRAPSFKVNSSVLKKRSTFFEAALAERWQSASSTDKANLKELYFPPWDPTASKLDQLRDRIALRNLFSFILTPTGGNGGYGFLVLSPPHEGLLLLDFARRVEMYHLPPPSTASLSSFIVAHGLDDPRGSPRRTLDVLLASAYATPQLSRNIRREAFLHAAGQYLSLARLPEYVLLVPEQMKLLLQRNHHAIAVRVQRSQAHLRTLAFPTIPGAGAAGDGFSPPSSSSSRIPSPPPGWEPAFKELRALLIAHYTKLFRTRHWPPRNFSRGLALQIIRDVQMLQSLLYEPHDPIPSSSSSVGNADPYRALMTAMTGSTRYPRVPNAHPGTRNHRLSPDEAAVVVLDCWSASSSSSSSASGAQAQMPASPGNTLIDRIRALEIRSAIGKTRNDFVEAREGRWVLLSVVRRAVEEVVGRGEWEGVKWGWGVEWWLCADWVGDDEDDEEEEEVVDDEGAMERKMKRERDVDWEREEKRSGDGNGDGDGRREVEANRGRVDAVVHGDARNETSTRRPSLFGG